MFAETKVEITKCDNGFVLVWRKPNPNEYQNISTGLPSSPTSGTEIHKTMKDVLEAVRKRLS